MGTVVNLKAARKARDRKLRETQAETNRALHGRTKAERAADAAAQARIDSVLDGAKRED